MSNLDGYLGCGKRPNFEIHYFTFNIRYSVAILMEAGIILLAAGSSSRMGRSKQLLPIKGEQLLVHAVLVALHSSIGPVIVVLGANENEHRKAISHFDVKMITNQHWKSGMGSSLKAGLKHLLLLAPRSEAVLVMVCDQPLLTSDHLKKLVDTFAKAGKPIAASIYSATAGVPAIFHKSLFLEILEVADDYGAKKIIQQHTKDTATLDFPEGSMDLDTPDDYAKFIE